MHMDVSALAHPDVPTYNLRKTREHTPLTTNKRGRCLTAGHGGGRVGGPGDKPVGDGGEEGGLGDA